MNIYILKYTENEELFLPFLSEQRKSKADSIKNKAVRREKIYSYALLRYALTKEYGFSEPPIFCYGERGKPYLENRPDIYFSLSHAGGYSACVLSDEEIGLDIQDFRPLKADISRKICTAAELEAVGASTESQKEICRLWCMKEARGKLTGMGFAEGFTEVDTIKLTEKGQLFCTEEPDGFYTAVCAHSAITPVRLIGVTEMEISDMLKSI